ncbi:MAG: glycosyltransferase family 4 protein [Rhodomicrobium sp.]
MKHIKKAPLIAFAWSGLPDYASRCIRAVIDRHPGGVEVIGTRPEVPIEGMELSLAQPAHWIDGSRTDLRWRELGLAPPALFFQGGYYWPAFRALGAECRAAGGAVVGLSDATWQGYWRQVLADPVRHRLLLRRKFDGWFVPGRSGLRHARIMGYPPGRTQAGMLGADPALFNGGGRLSQRPKTLLFVGRLSPIKNVLGLVNAFSRFAIDHPEWQLQICGSGPQRALLPSLPNMHIADFVQPSELVRKLQEARCLVLPSIREPWGVVVHEAALCGCALALSSSVGANDDLAYPENSVIFPPGDETAIEAALRELATWNAARWEQAEQSSRHLAQQFGPQRFANGVDRFIETFGVADGGERN